jgi:hypothetical protein
MIHTDVMPKFDYEQLIHGDRIDLIWEKIKAEYLKGLECTFFRFSLTKAEKSYLRLYGYSAKDIADETVIFWSNK